MTNSEKEVILEFVSNTVESGKYQDIERIVNLFETLVTGLEIISKGDPISIGLDEITEVCDRTLNKFYEAIE